MSTKRELLIRKRLHRTLAKRGKRHWKGQRFRSSDLPPRTEWGNTEGFQSHQKNGNPRCQAFSKNKIWDGKRGAEAQCPITAVVGHKSCSKHLGKRWRGSAASEPVSVMTQLRRYESHLPKYFLSTFLEAASDRNKLDNEREIDVLTARLMELFERLEGRQSRVGWQQVMQARDTITTALKTRDPEIVGPAVGVALGILNEAIKTSDYRAWDEIVNLISHRARLVSEENTRILKTAEVVNMSELMAIVAKTQEIIYSVVTDKAQQHQIGEMIYRQILAPDPMQLPDPRPVSTKKGPPPEKTKRGPNWAKKMGDAGCGVCNTPRFRIRHYQGGEYKCFNCGKLWEEADDPDIETGPPAIIEGEADEV